MKTHRLTGLVLATVAAVSLQQVPAQPLNLASYTTGGNGFYTNTFDSLGYSTNDTTDGTPTGPSGYLAGEWTCYINATANNFGSIAAGAPNNISGGSMNAWANPFDGGFFNYASYFDYIGGTNFYPNGLPTNATYGVIINPVYQTNEPNRALGIRQIGAFGDPGASFVLKLANTTIYENFQLSLDWMNLDPTSPRETTWQLQYGIADPVVGVPAAFQNVPGFNSVFINTPGSNHWKRVSISVPNGTVNNIDGQVWFRIVTLATSSGSGNRETFAIDNFGLTWTTGQAGCTPATNPITLTPPPAPVYSNATVAFSVNEGATQPLYYQWRYNGQDVSTVFPSQVVGYSYRSSILSLQNVTAANNGNYDCIVSNICGGTVYAQTSSVAVLVVTNVPTVTLGYLRTLTDPNNAYAPTVPVSQLWQVTGIITTFTNTTSGNTASYYLQDATGGMNLFVTGGSAFRPNMGDEVTAVGYLNGFEGNLEIEVDLTGQNNATSVTDLTNNIANYPVAKLLDWASEFAIGVTNRLVEQGTTNGVGSKKGSVCMLTNVYFGTNAGNTITGNYYVFVTNAAGVGGYLYFWGNFDTNLQGNVLPAFAYAVQGPLFAAETGGAGSFWSGIGVSTWADVMTSPIVVSVTRSGTSSTISWTAVPQTYSYNVLASANVNGPYTPIATGLKFSTSAASYVDVNNADRQFYRVTTP